MPEGQTLNIVIVLVCVGLSAFFSSSEAAFLSLQRTRLSHLVSSGVAGAQRVEGLVRRPDRLLSTILLGNNLVNVAFAALVTVITVDILEDEGTGVIVATVVGTAVLLIFGEIVPKTIAISRSERIALLFALPLKGIEVLFLPLVAVLQQISRLFLPAGGSQARSITENELRSLIDIGESEGAFEPAEAELLENVFRFGDRQVREVMTPRTEIVFIQRGASLAEFLDIYAEHSHARFPVYKDTTDNVVGILSAKDILKAMTARDKTREEPVTDVIRDVYFVPETKRVAELFDELRHTGNRISMVVDEFGGLAGLVTLKRLLEEIVGPVGEEGARPEGEYLAIDENTFRVDGGMSIEEVNEEIGVQLRDGDYETIAGFVLDVLGHIPVPGEEFEYENIKIEITHMDKLKIETIKLTREQQEETGHPS